MGRPFSSLGPAVSAVTPVFQLTSFWLFSALSASTFTHGRSDCQTGTL
jgi:hypothetical protein